MAEFLRGTLAPGKKNIKRKVEENPENPKSSFNEGVIERGIKVKNALVLPTEPTEEKREPELKKTKLDNLLDLSFIPLSKVPEILEKKEENATVQIEAKEGDKMDIEKPLGIQISGYNVSIKFEFQKSKGNPALTEKYRPEKMSDFVGNQQKIQEIRQWLIDHRQKKPGTELGLMIVGFAGSGKTTAAHLIPKDLGYSVQEINMISKIAGKRDSTLNKNNPNKEASFVVDGVLPAMARNNLGKSHVVVVDQIEDQGTKAILRPLWKVPASLELRVAKPLHGILQPVRVNATGSGRKEVKKGKKIIYEDNVDYNWPAPLIMTVNNFQNSSIYDLKNAVAPGAKGKSKLIKIVYFNRIEPYIIRKRLDFICKSEKILPNNLDMIAGCSRGDMRRAIMLLEQSCLIHETVFIRDHLGKDVKYKKMIPDQVKMVCSMISSPVPSVDNYTQFECTNGGLPIFNNLSPVMDEEETGEYIQDMNAQDVCSIALKQDHGIDYLENLFTKMDDTFIESMVHSHIPSMISSAHGKKRHPYLPKTTENCQCKKSRGDNNSESDFNLQPCPKHSDNVMDALSAICDSKSVSDIFLKSDAWKKNCIYPYYIQTSRVYPCVLARLPNTENRENLKINWEATKTYHHESLGGASNKKVSLLKHIFFTSES
jgi:hypothetical protein